MTREDIRQKLPLTSLADKYASRIPVTVLLAGGEAKGSAYIFSGPDLSDFVDQIIEQTCKAISEGGQIAMLHDSLVLASDQGRLKMRGSK